MQYLCSQKLVIKIPLLFLNIDIAHTNEHSKNTRTNMHYINTLIFMPKHEKLSLRLITTSIKFT